ncbi:RNA methyltransferase [Acidithiobacillus sp. M4-SHS-6]|uniref:RNA methyltransferase n=1 Tax=Acidithiobacillus sp. M4-SHS-6 TaxID=3383024 RepID=UPI0039BE71F2
MSAEILEGLRVVLVETSHPGNIGATARAMKVMGLQHLVLVNPRHFPHPEATALASGAEDILDRAQVRSDLTTALQGCHKVYGSSARDRRIHWPQLDAREAALDMVQELASGHCALVFGRERTGLSNEELDHCQMLVNIPTAELYHSLNLGQAVQVLAYELHMATLSIRADLPAYPSAAVRETPAPMEDMEGFYQHLEQVLRQSGFLQETRATRMMRRLRRLYDRARPSANEVHILRGVLTEIQRWAANSRQKGSG